MVKLYKEKLSRPIILRRLIKAISLSMVLLEQQASKAWLKQLVEPQQSVASLFFLFLELEEV